MGDLWEVRWHGRGGQGAVTAAKLLALGALEQGKHIQGFPEYGPERGGAPLQAFTRVSDEKIRVHCQVQEPKVVVVIDPTLVGAVDVTSGLPKDGVILVNTTETPAVMKKKLGLSSQKVFTVDASGIAMAKLKRHLPNTPMLGALAKATTVVKLEAIIDGFRKESKFSEQVTEANVAAIRQAYEEVKGA
jgi:pyruvate ferredoxin oxidoreductase gamma subunit